MTDNLTPPDFQEIDVLLSELLAETKKWGGVLSSGTKLDVSSQAVQDLFESKVSFGNPSDSLIQLTEDTFANSGVELTPLYKQQMQGAYNFYYMTLSVDLIPQPGAKFWRLVCQLDFGPKGQHEPIIQRLFPSDAWRSVMSTGVGLDIGLNGNLNWNAGVDSENLNQIADMLPAGVKANVVSKNNFSAFLTLPAFRYELGRPEVLISGEGNSLCYWRITSQDLQKVGTAKFGIVFKVPKEISEIALQGTAWAEPNMQWLTADLRDVASELSDRFKQLLRKKQSGASQLARWDAEKWDMALPAATFP
ncbi:MAG: hypothetical protein AAGF93_13390 [Cyanobacteria bacterium P01_H01_bin.105]